MYVCLIQPLDSTKPSLRRDRLDKRSRNEQEKLKPKDDRPSVLPAAFAEEEIAAEDRRPKKKVAVLIGYSGTGYRGMQM